jgi:hypothetical protein
MKKYIATGEARTAGIAKIAIGNTCRGVGFRV